MSTWYPQVTEKKGRVARMINYLKTHPLLCLLILTPGIPEYLSGSSNMALLVLSPPVFLLFLAANLALYGPGVILTREAKIRWNKGWASVFMMGAAYGIVEEGLALRTLFNPTSSVVGNLGVYGHWLGVNWVWTVGLVIFHSVFSIGLPIFIFGLAFPELKSKSLVSNAGIRISIVVLAADSIFLSYLVNYWPAEVWGLLILSSIVVTLLLIAAKKLPADFLKSVRAEPRWRPRAFFLLGVAFFPIWLLAGGFAAGANLFPPVVMVFDIVASLWLLRLVFRSMGTRLNQPHKVAFAFGLISPIIIFGIVASASFPLVIMNDLLVVLFSNKMWKKWKAWTFSQHYSLMQSLPRLGSDGPSIP
ncbi:MAG: hypothetical protein AUI50_01940 [Crenarchaeota archaeon 13_1_40CM_2_52_14]|nr:MAG: hypothetical protein AUI50_01940 [Crenarchaeota archaeon 13_1_40CM_2_52_14]OLE70627.1 MAG: hypothetical protein AUF78_05775 [archaeon 13_1_20CM_2_51_12]